MATESIYDYEESAAAIGSFEQEWPELSERVRRSLASRGVSAWLRDDIVQETGLRLFKMWDQVDAQRSPKGLALTIAHNILWDERNRKARGEVLGDVPEVSAGQDVERSGIARAELQKVWQLFPRLNPNHRSVLLAEIGGPAPSGSNSDAVKMLRMRARRKLTALMDGASAGIFVIGFEMKRLSWRVAAAVRRNTIAAEYPTGAVAAALCCGVIAALIAPIQLPAPSAEAKEGVNIAAAPDSLRRAVEELTQSSAKSSVVRPGRGGGRVEAPAAKAEPTEPGGTYLSFGDEDDPAGAGAGIEIVPREDDGTIKPPSCTPEVSETGVKVFCTVTAPDREVRAGTEIRLRP